MNSIAKRWWLAWVGGIMLTAATAAAQGNDPRYNRIAPPLAPSPAYAPQGLPDGPPLAYDPNGGTPPQGYAAPGDPVDRCDDCWGGSSNVPPLWSTVQGARFLARSRARETPWSEDSQGGVLRNGKSLTFDTVAPGYYATLTRHLGRDERNLDWFAELGFWGLNHWVASDEIVRLGSVLEATDRGLVTHGALNGPLGGQFPGLDWASEQTSHYNSEFESAELNLVLRPRGRSDRLVLYPSGKWQRECQPGTYWSFLVGARYFNADEQFELNGRGLFSLDANGNGSLLDPGDVPASVATGRYVVRTSNDLAGFQLGSDVMFRQCDWEWGLRLKAAPLVNVAEQESRITTVDPLFGNRDLSFEERHTKIAGLIEFGVVGRYWLQPNLAVHAAYDVAWLAGVALAPEQILEPEKLNTNGTIFFHGLTAGLEWRR